MIEEKKLKEMIGKSVGRYEIVKYIGSGSYGDVFEARHKSTDELVALKIPIQNGIRNGQSSILQEARIYKQIADPEMGVANMKVISCKEKKIIVMDLLGPNLETMLEKYKKMSLQTVIYLAIRMIDLMKYIHSFGYIHRDIKPGNFVLCKDKRNLFCIDFGLAKKYINRNDEHIQCKNTHKFCGTARYASVAAHKHMQQSRKDDLEAIGYILVYLYKGKLPWQGIKHKDKKEKYRLIGESKENTSEEEICENMPREFTIFLKYVRNLDFDEKPHYTSLKKMFEKLYDSRGYNKEKLEWQKNEQT